MKILRILLVLSLAVTAALGCATSVASDWQLLGSRVVNDRTETDVIHVGANEGRLSKLRLDVGKAPIVLKRMVITFGNGGKQIIERNMLISKKGSGIVLDIKGGKRVVNNVRLTYEAASRGFKKATVRLYGK